MNQQAQSPTQSDQARKNKLKLIWGLICLIGPIALIILSILLYAIVNFLTASSEPVDASELTGSQSPGLVFANITLFIVGAFSVLALLPGMVVGIVLLANRK